MVVLAIQIYYREAIKCFLYIKRWKFLTLKGKKNNRKFNTTELSSIHWGSWNVFPVDKGDLLLLHGHRIWNYLRQTLKIASQITHHPFDIVYLQYFNSVQTNQRFTSTLYRIEFYYLISFRCLLKSHAITNFCKRCKFSLKKNHMQHFYFFNKEGTALSVYPQASILIATKLQRTAYTVPQFERNSSTFWWHSHWHYRKIKK